ncbi:hypothetical protein ACHAXS_000618 [Conticribra weissflogii]
MMFPIVSKSLPTQDTKSNESLAAMTAQIKVTNTNTMGDNNESEPVCSTSITPMNNAFKHYQHDEPNPQHNSICEDKQINININQLSTNDDLAILKKEDPFMYYSIPAVKKAEYLFQDVDVTILKNSCMRRNSISCPGRMESEEFSQPMRSITRKSRISFECHNSGFESSFLDDLYDDEEL